MTTLDSGYSFTGGATTVRASVPSVANRLGLLLAALAMMAGGLGLVPTAAAAAEVGTITITGGGWGHGRGMGQYGAYGYALNQGWSSERILDHFYGGTTAGPAPAGGAINPNRLRVDLRSHIGSATRVSLTEGSIIVGDADGTRLGTATGAVRIVRDGSLLVAQRAAGCSGPWTELARTSTARIELKADSTATGRDGLLAVCGSTTAWYEGEIWSTVGNGYQRTINVVPVETYLRGVVPNEMPASWHQEALEAQAVAARSYVMAGDPRRGVFSDTCDDIYCQVYDGRYTTRGGLRSSTHPNTDVAIAATAGLVRLTPSGSVARTEFSSSTGGYTAGGDFPAVEDQGDAIGANPNARWTVEIPTSKLEQAYGRGLLLSIDVTKRNGRGPFGGRVLSADLRFEKGTVTVSGDSLRYRLGLKSDLFAVGPVVRGSTSTDAGTSTATTVELVTRTYQRFLDRDPSSQELSDGLALVGSDGAPALARALAHHPDFAGRMIDTLYRSALGRSPDAAGRGYWVERMQRGMRYEQVGTFFYGSGEYRSRTGGTDAGYIDSLYREILGRGADVDGRSYWVGRLESGASSPTIANSFYRSVESRRDRARSLGLTVLGRELDAGRIETLAQALAEKGDLVVAAEIGLWD